MIGTIHIEGLEIECIIGIHPEEREKPQVLLVDVALDRDFSAAASTDAVGDTVDYVDVAQALTSLAVESQFQLIETFAERATTLLLSQFNCERAAIKIMKPSAIPEASWAAVSFENRQ